MSRGRGGGGGRGGLPHGLGEEEAEAVHSALQLVAVDAPAAVEVELPKGFPHPSLQRRALQPCKLRRGRPRRAGWAGAGGRRGAGGGCCGRVLLRAAPVATMRQAAASRSPVGGRGGRVGILSKLCCWRVDLGQQDCLLFSYALVPVQFDLDEDASSEFSSSFDSDGYHFNKPTWIEAPGPEGEIRAEQT
jgi:hypothetical protein